MLSTGGSEVTAYRIARGLASRHEIDVICSRQPGALAEELIDGHRVLRVGPETPYSQFGYASRRARFQFAARQAIARSRADVVLSFALVTSWAATSGARALGVPAVTFVTDVWQGRWSGLVGPLAGPIAERIERFLIGRPWARYAANSGVTAERLVSAGIGRDQVVVVPPVVEVEAAAQAPPLRTSGRPVLSHVGRLVRYKGVDTLVRATALLAKRHPDVRLLVVGEGPERPSLERLAADLGVSANVEFLGAGPDLSFAWRAMAASHAFCLASTVEGFGIVVPEAMAVGTPVICSDIPALRWVSGGGAHARLVPPGDAAAFAGAVEECLADLARPGDRVGAARTWAEQFSAERVCGTVEGLLDEVVRAWIADRRGA